MISPREIEPKHYRSQTFGLFSLIYCILLQLKFTYLQKIPQRIKPINFIVIGTVFLLLIIQLHRHSASGIATEAWPPCLTKPDLTWGRQNSISQCLLAEKQQLMNETIGLKGQGTPRQQFLCSNVRSSRNIVDYLNQKRFSNRSIIIIRFKLQLQYFIAFKVFVQRKISRI